MPSSKKTTVTDDENTAAVELEVSASEQQEMTEAGPVFETVSDMVVSEFGGRQPSVPYAPGVDVVELTKGDDDPFFLTMPLSHEGTVSKNGLIHDKALGDAIAAQIVANRPGGIMGHIPEDQRTTAFPVSQIHWVGAVKSGATTWGKGYIPRTFPEVREEYRILKSTRGKTATSIYGKAVKEFADEHKRTWRAKDFKLDQVDLAPYSRAAAPGTGEFYITREMQEESGEPDSNPPGEPGQPVNEIETDERGPRMPDNKNLIAELTADEIQTLPQFAAVREAVIAEYQATHATEQQIAELTGAVETATTRISELEAEAQAKDLMIAEFQTRQFDADMEAKIAELTAWEVNTDDGKAALASLRSVIRQMALAKLGTVREMAQAETTLTELVDVDLKALIEMTRDRLAGPPVLVPGTNNRPAADGAVVQVDDTPETRQKAANAYSFSKG